jgi:hypothetical protein
VTEINTLADLRPGDIMFGPIGGLVGLGVGLGQLALGEAFRVGRLSIRHVGIVVEASVHHVGPTLYDGETGHYLPMDDAPGPLDSYAEAERSGYVVYRSGVITAPRLVQAMPGGAEEIEMRASTHWTPRHAYARLPEDWPGQAVDAAAIARLMVSEGVAYSFASYAALALWRWGVKTPRLEKWIGRRGKAVKLDVWSNGMEGRPRGGRLPLEAICSVLADQAWTLAGKQNVVEGTRPQIVTPGMLAGQLWRRPGVVWGGPGLL